MEFNLNLTIKFPNPFRVEITQPQIDAEDIREIREELAETRKHLAEAINKQTERKP